MNIYLVSRTDSVGWDQYDSFVIACKDEETAKNTYPTDFINEGDLGLWDGEKFVDSTGYVYSDGWAATPKTLKVELLGKAAKGVRGILCASFNAG